MSNHVYLPPNVQSVARQLGGLDDEVGGAAGDASGSFDWMQLPAIVRDLYLAHNQTQLAQRVLELNISRQAAGLPPLNIDLNTLRPGVQVGMTSDVKWLLGGLGVAAIAAVALSGRRR